MPKCPMGAICGEILGTFQKEFPSGLFYHVWVSAKCLSTAGLECFELMRGLLGLGGSPRVAFGVVPPIDMLSMGSGEGCPLLGLGDCLGAGEGEAAAVGCSSTGEVFCGRTSGGDRGVCPNRRWYEVARAPLSCGGLLYKTTWQAERKSLGLLLSSPLACSSRSHMHLPCSLWNITAWETFWALASQKALEQAALASWTKWLLVVLAFLTATRKSVLASRINQEQAVLASRVAWEQMTWASSIDAATWDSFWWSIMPSSQTALHLLASMDPLVLSRSLRALLALVWSSARSIKGLTLLLLETAAIGEILAGMSCREASASLMLTWNEVSTAWSRPSGFWGGVMSTTAVVDLLGDECSDSQLDASSTAWDRRLLTSVVILPSDFRGNLCGLVIRMVETLPRGGIFWSGSSTGSEAISISR